MPPTLAQAEALVDALSPEDKLRLRGYLDARLSASPAPVTNATTSAPHPDPSWLAYRMAGEEMAKMPSFMSVQDALDEIRR